MKKQILFLSFLVLAVLAGVTNSYGQLAPRTINCLPSDALHPVAGTEYTYQIDVPATPNPGDAWSSMTYLWYVTQLDLGAATPDDYFIDPLTGDLRTASDDGDGTGIFLANASGDYSNTGVAAVGANNDLTLTWKSFTYDANKPVFVVIYTKGNNGVCDTENMKVFKIEPINAFTLDIDNLQADATQHTPTTYGDLYKQCVSDIVSARWGGTGVVYDYGVNYLYYEVVAANWSNSWNPSVQLTGINPLETITVEWSEDNDFSAGVHPMTTTDSHTAVSDVLTYTSVDNVIPDAGATGTVGASGENIYIRVTLDHSVSGKESYQGLEDQNIVLAVDGQTGWDAVNSVWTTGDVHWDNTGTAPTCDPLVVDNFDNDKASQDLKARPTIINSSTSMPSPGLQPVVVPNP